MFSLNIGGKMGVKLSSLVPREEIKFEDLAGKKVAVDFSNAVFQFLASIRQQDGTQLMDSKGRVTSHLQGILSRSCNLLSRGIKLCYVFDGKAPESKLKEQEKRRKRREEAEAKFKIAIEKESVEEMYKYSKRTVRLTWDITDESKKLIGALGIPIVQAPCEADAQLAYMCKNKDVDYAASSDYDCLLFGALRFILNLTLSQKRRLPGGGYVTTGLETVELDKTLKELKINQDQLIFLGILVGTDYNPGGVKGIGPKNALKLVRKCRSTSDFDKLLKDVDFDWEKIFDLFKNMGVEKRYKLKWDNIDIDAVERLLVEEHDFSQERVRSILSKVTGIKEKAEQTDLGGF